MRKRRFSISTVPRTIRLMFLFGTSRQSIAKMFTSAQTCERLNIRKVSGHEEAHQSYNPSFPRAEEIMKTSTKDKIEGSFHEVKGAFKEQVGKATNDRVLKAEGKSNIAPEVHRSGSSRRTMMARTGRCSGLRRRCPHHRNMRSLMASAEVCSWHQGTGCQCGGSECSDDAGRPSAWNGQHVLQCALHQRRAGYLRVSQ